MTVENHLHFFAISMVMIGMAWIFYRADSKSPTTRASSLFLLLVGLSVAWAARDVFTNLPNWSTAKNIVAYTLETLAILVAMEWVRRVARTIATQENQRWFGGVLLRFAQAIIVSYWILTLIFPNLKQVELAKMFSDPSAVFHLAFWIHYIPQTIGLLISGFAILMISIRKCDIAERRRLQAMVISTPFLMANNWIAAEHFTWTPLVTMFGVLIFFSGTIRYLMTQGQRGQFLSQFMSPQVSRLVQREGLRKAMQADLIDLSVVACDLRGFTAYARKNKSTDVLTVLHRYYQAVGDITKQFGGTVKDHAGDGVLTLVGAPVEYKDHKQRAIDMAICIRAEGLKLLKELNVPQLGLGVGIATGKVTVGAIGGSERLEYAAVGNAVNLAARLCDKAKDGEILADPNVLSETQKLEYSPIELSLKGMGEAVTAYPIGYKIASQKVKTNIEPVS